MPETIQELRVRAVRVPMPEPHRTAGGVVSESPLVLIDATLSNGVTGRGIVFTYTPMALVPTAELVRNLAPLVQGQPLAPRDIWERLNGRFRLLGPQGLTGMAVAGIDMALWDAAARSQGVPLVRLLGGSERPIQAYGAVGYDGVRESAAVAERWAKLGFRGVKAKIGYPTVQEDIEVIRAIRKAMGPEAAIMVDYNQCLTVAEAIGRLRALEDLNLTWVEEPTLAHDFAGHARIAKAIETPIQCGENWWGPLDFRHAIEAQASDYLMPEVMKTGGITGWLRAAAMAEAHGLRISSHLWPEVSAHMLSLSPMAHWLEFSDWWHPIIQNPIAVENGHVTPSSAAGSGFEWNEPAIQKCLV